MDAREFIALLRKSGNRILENMADSLEGAVDKTSPEAQSILSIGEAIPMKQKLERFLSSVVAYMEHDGKPMLLSSSVVLLHHLEARRAAKNRNRVVGLIGRSARFTRIIRSTNPHLVRTWDLVENDKHSIPVESKWRVLGWIVITSDNVDILSDSVNAILTRGEYGDGR
jgi:hypothetical protein